MVMTKAELDKVNRRRVDLIVQKHGSGITEQEAVELAELKRVVAAEVQRRAPRVCDKPDRQHERIAAMLQKCGREVAEYHE